MSIVMTMGSQYTVHPCRVSLHNLLYIIFMLHDSQFYDHTVIYACDVWKRTAMMAHRLDVFHRRCLHTILGITWSDHATNEEVMRRAGRERLQNIIEQGEGK